MSNGLVTVQFQEILMSFSVSKICIYFVIKNVNYSRQFPYDQLSNGMLVDRMQMRFYASLKIVVMGISFLSHTNVIQFPRVYHQL